MANVNHHHHHNLDFNPPIPFQVELMKPPKDSWRLRIGKMVGIYIADLIKLAIPIVGALYGYNYVNSLEQKREQENRLKTTRINASIQAFDSLSRGAILYKINGSGIDQIQSAFSRIQLFGDSEQIQMVKSLENSKTKTSIDINPIFQSVRNSLRKDLGLSSDTTEIIVARQDPNPVKTHLSPGLWVKCETYPEQYYKITIPESILEGIHTEPGVPFSEFKCPICKKTHVVYKNQILKISSV